MALAAINVEKNARSANMELVHRKSSSQNFTGQQYLTIKEVRSQDNPGCALPYDDGRRGLRKSPKKEDAPSVSVRMGHPPMCLMLSISGDELRVRESVREHRSQAGLQSPS